MKKVYYFILLILLNNFLFSQETEFKPSGKIIARAFVDYSNNFNNESGFDITRGYLGYKYQLLPSLKAQVMIDGAAGKNSAGNQQVFLRNAFLEWEYENLTLTAGLIGLLQFSYQDEYSQIRYVMQSFQNLNNMGQSADIGIIAAYKFNSLLSADFALTNGEGFKKIKKDDNMRYALGVNFTPVEGMLVRLYGDIYNTSKDTLQIKRKDQSAVSLMAGYKNEKFTGGAEVARLFNKGLVQGKDFYGYSLFANLKIAPKWRTFARFDWGDSQKPSGSEKEWSETDGQLMLVGVEYQPIKQLKISPNFRNINYNGKDSEQYLFINLDFNL